MVRQKRQGGTWYYQFIKDGKMYRVPRCYQLSQAHKANIDYKIGKYLVPETVKFQWKDSDYHD